MLKTNYLVMNHHTQKNKILCSVNILHIHMKPLQKKTCGKDLKHKRKVRTDFTCSTIIESDWVSCPSNNACYLYLVHAVKILACIQTFLNEVFHGFPQSLQGKFKVVPQLHNKCFPPNLFISHHSTVITSFDVRKPKTLTEL